jgi:hypothetical protein
MFLNEIIKVYYNVYVTITMPCTIEMITEWSHDAQGCLRVLQVKFLLMTTMFWYDRLYI